MNLKQDIKIGFVILAHKNPQQLLRLIQSLFDANFFFFIHIDKRSNPRVFKKIIKNHFPKNIFFIKSIKTYWGSFNQLSVSINGFEMSYEMGMDFTFLISGQDYTIKSKAQIKEFIIQNLKYNFLSIYSIPAPHWEDEMEIKRIKKFYFHINGKLFEYPLDYKAGFLRKGVDLILKLFLRKERSFPSKYTPYGGGFWVSLN